MNGLPPSEEKKYALTVTDFRGCQIAYEAQMYRRAVLAVELSYHDNTFCTTENNPLPRTNDAGGKFYCLEKGLNVDETTGELDLAIATEGIYQIVYELDVCSQDTFQITIDGRCLENLPNTITPNADGVNDVWQSPIFDRYPNMTVRFF